MALALGPQLRSSASATRQSREDVYVGPAGSARSNAEHSDQVEWYLLASLLVEVRWESGQYVAIEDSTGLFGEGDNQRDAIADLRSTLQDHLRDLQAQAGLAVHLQAQLERLSTVLPR